MIIRSSLLYVKEEDVTFYGMKMKNGLEE